jgi:SAM-dependent methyltransferase
MFDRSVPYYDALYSFKDYAEASGYVHRLISHRCPDARSLLDVACGTGAHLDQFRAWYQCRGIDLSPAMVALARERCPGVVITQGNMVAFDLDDRYDVVTCLFSSVGYVVTVENMHRAVATMARHARPGGLVIIEPWLEPERYITNRLTTNIVDYENTKIVWMYTSERVGDTSVFDIHYLVGDDTRVEHFTERHVMGLFTAEQYEQAFRQVDLHVDYDPVGPFGRGLYIGRKAR